MVNIEGSLSADLIAQQNFPPARRGFDPEEVRSFLVKVAAEIVALHERQAALESARRDAEYRAAHPSFDEETLLGAVGEETAQILRSAHEAAADIKNRAEENASRILKEAHLKGEATLAEAETILARRTEEAEGVASRIKEAARVEAERLMDQARQQSKAIRAQAEAERNAMVEGAQATREKILASLTRKRNVAVAQVEQLRAGRERLLQAYDVVRRTLEEATSDLARAEVEARAAADAVRHRPLTLDEPDGLDEEPEATNPTLPIVQKWRRPVASEQGVAPPPPRTMAPAPRGAPAAPAALQATPRPEGPTVGLPHRKPQNGQDSASAATAPPPAASLVPSDPGVPDNPAPDGADPESVPDEAAGPHAAVTTATPDRPAGTPPGSSSVPDGAPDLRSVVNGSRSPQEVATEAPAAGRQPPAAASPAAGTGSTEAPAGPEPAQREAAADGSSRSQPPTAAGLQPPTAAGLQPTTAGGPQPTTAAGLQSATAGGPQPPTSAGPQSATAGGPQPPTSAGPQSATAGGPQPPKGAPAAEASGADDPLSATAAAEGPRPPSGGDSVGWLFARIRADREQAVSWAQEVLAEEHPVADGDEALLQRRDRAVDSIESNLTRRLKRSLQDDQNNVLDRLRSLRPSQRAADVVLPSGDAHSARFRDASKPFLSEALAAGAAFTASLVPGAKAPDNLTGAADQAADALAAAVLEPLRRRLSEVLAAGDGDDPVVLAEAVGAAYREWKTKRVEVAASDAVAEAFAQGAYAATPAGTDLRWLVCDVDGPCPDCDDNALAGEQPKGEPFPTGQPHPPAHPGCRCVLVAHLH